jgi:hypothetical protein
MARAGLRALIASAAHLFRRNRTRIVSRGDAQHGMFHYCKPTP